MKVLKHANRTSDRMSVQSWCNYSSSAVISRPKSPWKRSSVPSVNRPLRRWEKELTMCGNEPRNGATMSYINMPVSLSTSGPQETARRSLSPWNYTGNTWLALVIHLNCCHLHFNHLSHTAAVSASPYCEGECRNLNIRAHRLLIFTEKYPDFSQWSRLVETDF